MLFVFLIVFILSTYKSFYNYFFLSHDCEKQAWVKNLGFDGYVKKKYLDSNEHNIKTFLIVNSIGRRETEIKLNFDQDAVLWDKFHLGDTIKKTINTVDFYVTHNAKTDTVKLIYNCDQ